MITNRSSIRDILRQVQDVQTNSNIFQRLIYFWTNSKIFQDKEKSL